MSFSRCDENLDIDDLSILSFHAGIFSHVAINDNGDREADYTLWDMTQLTDGTFEVRF